MRKYFLWVLVFQLAFGVLGLVAQTGGPSAFEVVEFRGVLKDLSGQPLTGLFGITFTLYQQEFGGVALWLETQNVEVDQDGRYKVLLGSQTIGGIPQDLFQSGQARWVGVQVGIEAERPRVRLGSAPYALKAADADTLAGRSASEFVLKIDAGGGGGGSAGGGALPLITSVTAGSGLTGGGTSGDLVLALDLAFTDGRYANVAGDVFSGDVTVPNLFSGNITAGGVVSGASLVGGTGSFTGPLTGATGTFNGNTPGATAILNVTQNGDGFGVLGITSSSLTQAVGVWGQASANTGLVMGVKASSGSTSGRGIWAEAVAQSGPTMGVFSQVFSSGGTAGVFNNQAGGKVLSGKVGPREIFSVDGGGNVGATGTVTAAKFAGDGSGLTNLPATSFNFDVATQTELDAESAARQQADVLLQAGLNGAAKLAGGNIFTGDQEFNGTIRTGGNTTEAIFNIGQNGNGNGLMVTTVGGGAGIVGSTFADGGIGVNGEAVATTGFATGVLGTSDSIAGRGVEGRANAATGNTFGVVGSVQSPTGVGVHGSANASTGPARGVLGTTNSDSGEGVRGETSPTTGPTVAIHGIDNSPNGVAGRFDANAGGTILLGTVVGAQKFQVTGSGDVSATGTVTAAKFAGDGSLLTNVASAATAANADTLDGLDSSAFALAGHGHDVSQVANAASLILGTEQSFIGNLRAPNFFANGSVNGASGIFSGNSGSPILSVIQAGSARAVSAQSNGQAVAGIATGEVGSGVLGNATSSSGLAVGVRGISNSSRGVAGLFENNATTPGKILSGRSSGTEVFSVDAAGNVNAQGDLVAEAGNVRVLAPGAGIILKSPDGTICVRLSIDNGGNLVTVQTSCSL